MSKRDYWNKYYEAQDAQLLYPSPFAAFTLNEFCDYELFLDIGCGNGRDSIFFKNYVDEVLAVDYSKQAISLARKRFENSNLNIKFSQIDFSKPTAIGRFNKLLNNKNKKKILYSRFFIHAITEETEEIFLSACDDVMNESDYLCLEFRNTNDKKKEKVTPDHYRRYINTNAFIKRAIEHGFELEYRASGRGMAKYKQDDASVSRVILK